MVQRLLSNVGKQSNSAASVAKRHAPTASADDFESAAPAVDRSGLDDDTCSTETSYHQVEGISSTIRKEVTFLDI